MCNSSSSWPGIAGEEEGGADHPGRDQGRGGSLRRSFPSSLTWDSDSEKETVDGKEPLRPAGTLGRADQPPGFTATDVTHHSLSRYRISLFSDLIYLGCFRRDTHNEPQ